MRIAITIAQCSGAAKASAMPASEDEDITIRIQRRRPSRSASSLPRIEAGTAARLTTAATVAALQGEAPADPTPAAKPRKATIQPREPNSSRQCTP